MNYDKVSSYFKENKLLLVLLAVTGLCFDGFMCLLPLMEGNVLNAIKANDKSMIINGGIVFLILVLFLQTNRFLKRYFVRVFANRIILKMREVAFKNLLDKDMQFFDSSAIGEILSRNTDDIYASSEGIRKVTTEIFDTFVLMIGYFISMLLLDYKVTLMTIPFIILAVLTAYALKKVVYRANKSYKEYLAIHKAKTLNMAANMLKWRGYGVEGYYEKEYRGSLQKLKAKTEKALICESSLEPAYLMVAYLGLILLTYFSGVHLIQGIYELDVFYSLLTTYFLLATKSSKVGKLFNAYQGFKVSFTRIKPYLITKETTAYHLQAFNSLKLQNFSVHYEEGFKLPLVNLEVTQGMIVGVCGEVHTGKSTFLKALTGLYPYDGEALLGCDKLSNTLNDERALIGYLSNTSALFEDSLANNIALGRPNGTVSNAIYTACLDDKFKDLTQKLSFSNQNISGGEAKRVMLARSVYDNDVKILLLDDPFLSIDKEMALTIFDRLKNDSQIIFMVSNQDYLLKQTDKILFFTDNEAIYASYNELLNNKLFKEMMVSSNGR